MTKRPNYVFDDELYHHGILGQRWGNRRFQNEDGSWTPEGRERYGKGDSERVKIEKAKAAYETQKYKANLKSKAQKEKDKRAAAEERNRIKEQAKTNKLIKKEQTKLDQQGSKKFKNTKNMSDEDLSKAIDRLKLQSEYNKQYYLAKNPDGALAKADRFFDGPTGQAVTKIAVATLPAVATAATNKLLESSLKYSNKLDKEKMEADIDKVRAEAEAKRNPVNNKGTKEHDAAVKERAERMFGKNKDVAKESVNKDQPKASSGKTGIKGDKWATVSSNTAKTAEYGYRLYKLYSDKVSSSSVDSIKTVSSNSKLSNYLPEKKAETVLQLPASQIAGYLPARSEVLNKKK